MKVTLVDSNARGMQTMIDVIGVCRGKECSEQTIYNALDAKPVPHLSALEFGWVCLKVEGVSVKARLQLVRHRLFSTMERSTRSIDMSSAEMIVPDTAENPSAMRRKLMGRKMEYAKFLEAHETFEDASYLLPMGTETTFYLAGNLRIWYEYFQKRLCKKHVQDEHYRLALEMYRIITEHFLAIKKAHPCKACGACKGGGDRSVCSTSLTSTSRKETSSNKERIHDPIFITKRPQLT